MTAAERLLDLTLEYAASKDSRSPEYDGFGAPGGREPAEIAEDYARTLREVIAD